MNQNDNRDGFCYHEIELDRYDNLVCKCGKIFRRNRK